MVGKKSKSQPGKRLCCPRKVPANLQKSRVGGAAIAFFVSRKQKHGKKRSARGKEYLLVGSGSSALPRNQLRSHLDDANSVLL